MLFWNSLSSISSETLSFLELIYLFSLFSITKYFTSNNNMFCSCLSPNTDCIILIRYQFCARSHLSTVFNAASDQSINSINWWFIQTKVTIRVARFFVKSFAEVFSWSLSYLIIVIVHLRFVASRQLLCKCTGYWITQNQGCF